MHARSQSSTTHAPRTPMRNRISNRCYSFNAAVAFGGAVILFSLTPSRGQDEPKLIADVADFNALLPLLPEPPEGWSAEQAEGSTDDLGDTKITTVHRDYQKGDGDAAPTCSISIL